MKLALETGGVQWSGWSQGVIGIMEITLSLSGGLVLLTLSLLCMLTVCQASDPDVVLFRLSMEVDRARLGRWTNNRKVNLVKCHLIVFLSDLSVDMIHY